MGLSTGHAVERRIAINLAWEWGGVGVAYFLLRNLPRTRGESSALLGALAATAVAVSAYGLYQAGVEIPQMRREYWANPEATLLKLGADPTPGSSARQHVENRLLFSSEPFSTFALANTLAGYLVGPLVLAVAVGAENLRRRGRDGTRTLPATVVVLLAAIPFLIALSCFLLTKSRSATAGFAVGLLVVAWGLRGRIRSRTLALSGLGLAVVLFGLGGAMFASGWLDREVLTQSTLSLRYRLEYWQGTWNLLRSDVRTANGAELPVWWWGLGPGNFRGPYLRHKLAASSEEIADPHNLVLEAWSTAGLLAALALVAAIGFGLWDLLRGPKSGPESAELPAEESPPPAPSRPSKPGPADPPRQAGWLVIWAGLGGLLAELVLGDVRLPDLFQADNGPLIRWSILGLGWLLAAAFGGPLWRRRPIPTAGVGAAVAAIVIGLLAAGGIGYAPVALMLWGFLGLGMNLRDDRTCGRWRFEAGGLWAFLPAALLVALCGTFYGAVLPFWQAQAMLDEADERIEQGLGGPSDLDRIAGTLRRAGEADAYAARAWLALAELEYQTWRARGRRPGWRPGPSSSRPWPRPDSRPGTPTRWRSSASGSSTPGPCSASRGSLRRPSRRSGGTCSTPPARRSCSTRPAPPSGPSSPTPSRPRARSRTPPSRPTSRCGSTGS